MIEAKGLAKSFGNKRVLQEIDLTVDSGEFVTVFGPNGAGKSTLVHILAGIMRPTAGRIWIEGIDTKEDPVKARRNIGLVSHQPFLYHELTAVENLTFYGRMFDVSHLARRIDEILQQVGLELRAHDPVRTFSRGMTQRLAIARALLHRPSVLLLDEPYTGLDRQAGETLREILKDLETRRGTVIMATHDVERGLELCHRAVVLVGGHIVSKTEKKDLKVSQFDEIYAQYVGGGI